jgi:hypothetical protein
VKRTNVVRTRFTADEIVALDQLRGDVPRARWLREAGLARPAALPGPRYVLRARAKVRGRVEDTAYWTGDLWGYYEDAKHYPTRGGALRALTVHRKRYRHMSIHGYGVATFDTVELPST